MAAAGFRPLTTKDHRKTPGKWSRLGIPAGMHRAEAEAAWVEAEQQADTAVRGLEACGVVPATVLPDSDEALAKATLHALAVLALGPMKDKRTKATALGVLLDYTKSKPAERQAISKADNPTDEWMQSVLEADSQPPAEHRRA